MFYQNLPRQIAALIDHYCGGSLNAFAKKIGIPQSTLQNKMAKGDDKHLLNVLPAILESLPEVNETWLYTGKGDTFCRPRTQGVRSATNRQEKLVGDILSDAWESAGIDPDDAGGEAKIDPQEWRAILESSEYPSFQALEALYACHAFNPACLFANGNVAFLPATKLQTIAFFLGKNIKKIPDALELVAWFGCSGEEARNYLKEYQDWLSDGKKPDDEPILATKWLEYFCSHAELKTLPDNILTGSFISFRSTERKIDSEKISELQNKIILEQSKVIAEMDTSKKLYEENARLKEEIFELKKILLSHDKINHRESKPIQKAAGQK